MFKKKVLAVLLSMVMAMTMLVGMPISAKAVSGEYNIDDLAAMNALLAAHPELNLPAATAAQLADGNSYPSEWDGGGWPYVLWSSDATDKRINGLDFYTCGLTGTLDLSDFDALESLDVRNNSLTSLVVSSNTALLELHCNRNYLVTLDVSNLTNLLYLDCYRNNLVTLDVSNLTNLWYLDCSNNNLLTLNVSNTNLEVFGCGANRLSTLDVTGLTNLKRLYCENNFMTDIDKVIGKDDTDIPAEGVNTGVGGHAFIFYPQKFFTLDNASFNIPAGLTGTAITSVDVSSGVYHGTAPYTYSISSGPSWLSINSATGVITGTRPATAQAATTATITVTDSAATPASSTIDITVGAVYVAVCEIGTTQYTSIFDAIAAVPTGGTTQTVIKLLVDITESQYTVISDQKITFDLNGKNLIFTGRLGIMNGSTVSYTGSGQFKSVYNWISSTSGSSISALWIDGASSVVLTGIEIVDTGVGTNREAWGLDVSGGSTVTVNGDVKATGGVGVGCGAIGIILGLGTVTVNGDLISDGYGVLSYDSATNAPTLTVNGGAIKADWGGVLVYSNATLTITGDIEVAGGDGVVVKAGSATNPTTVTINGNISAGNDGVVAEAYTVVTINGDIDAGDNGVFADGATVTINGDIDSEGDGVYAEGGAKVTINGDIVSYFNDGVEAWNPGTEVTVTGSIEADWWGVYANDGAKVTVGGSIVAGDIGVLVLHYSDDTEVNIGGNITAVYNGVVATGKSVVYVGGNIVVTAPDDPDEAICGVFVANGAKVTVDGTITAPNYIGFLIPFGDDGDPWFYYLSATQNTTPSDLPGYKQYDDEGKYDMFDSYVWVKAATTPGTGDSTALALLLGALLVAALGTGLVFAHRRREQEV